jgi:hypothetical protein
MSPLVSDPHAVIVLAPQLVEASVLLDVLAPLGTGDVFCAAVPQDDAADDEYSGYLEDDEYAYYSATISDTIATFLVDIERPDPASAQTRYEVHVTDSGPGADRLRYRIAKAVIEATGGGACGPGGVPIELSAPEQDPFGALW